VVLGARCVGLVKALANKKLKIQLRPPIERARLWSWGHGVWGSVPNKLVLVKKWRF
jgi:hypothetical protein